MNQAERVTTLADGSRHMDPFTAIEMWAKKEGMWHLDADEIIDAFNQQKEAESVTGSLFPEGVTA